MRTLIFLICLQTSAAHAHPGHIEALAGHDHWVAGIAIGIAIAIGLGKALGGRAKEAEPEADEAEESPA